MPITLADRLTPQQCLALTRHKAYAMDWRAFCRFAPDLELGLEITHKRRTLVMADEEGLPSWYVDAIRDDLAIAEEAWEWRLRAQRKGGPNVEHGDFRGRLDALREKHDIVGLIGMCVALRRSGSEWQGLCPLHYEKTPSFHVNEEKGVYHCFGCGEGGDIFDWVQFQLNEDFMGAVRWLESHSTIGWRETMA